MTSAEELSSARAERDAIRMRRDVQTSARMARPPRPDLPAPARESMVPPTVVSDTFEPEEGQEEEVVLDGVDDGDQATDEGGGTRRPGAASVPSSSSSLSPVDFTNPPPKKTSSAPPLNSRQAAQRMMHHFTTAETDLYRHLTPAERARLRRSTCTPGNAWWARTAYSDPETWLVLALLVGAVLALAVTAVSSPGPARPHHYPAPLSYYRRSSAQRQQHPHASQAPHNTGVLRRHATLAADKLAAYAGSSRASGRRA